MPEKVQTEIQSAWDHGWFVELQAIKAPRFIGTNYRDAKNEFFKNLGAEPIFEYSNILETDTNTAYELLDELNNKIESERSVPGQVIKFYQDKLSEVFSKLEIHRLSQEQVLKHRDRREQIEKLVESSYGKPSQEVFNHLLKKLKEKYIQLSFPVIKSQHYRDLGFLFEEVPSSTIEDLVLMKQTVDDDGPIYKNATEVKHRMQEALRLRGLDGWKVTISNRQFGGFRVLPMKKLIVVPSTKILRARKGERQLSEARLLAIIEHEIGTHAVRAHNGYNSRLRLLGVGLAGYHRGEEGLATYREQEVVGADDYANINMYFAVSIAYGLDRGGVKRTFYETFKVLHNYFYVFYGLSGTYSKSKAFNTCHRIYRGATGTGTAYVVTKDIAYREGNIAIHALLKKKPAGSWLDVGKFDPANSEHVAGLQELELIK